MRMGLQPTPNTKGLTPNKDRGCNTNTSAHTAGSRRKNEAGRKRKGGRIKEKEKKRIMIFSKGCESLIVRKGCQ